MENAIYQWKNVILGSFCVLVQPLPQHIIPCKYWTEPRCATSEQHLWLPRTYTGSEIKLLGACKSSESTHWPHQVSSAAQANPNGRIMDRNDSTAHCHIKNCSFLTYGCMCMCVCVFLTELQCLCAGAVTGEGKPGQPHSTLLRREGPAQVPWGRTSPTVPQHPPRVVPCRVLWPQGVRGTWVPWEAVGAPGFSHCSGVTGVVKAIQVVWGCYSAPCGDLTLMAVGVILRMWGWCLHPALPPAAPSAMQQCLVMVLALVVVTGGVHLLLATPLSGCICFLLLFQFSLLKGRVKNSKEIIYIKNRCMWKQPSRWYSLAHEIWEKTELRWHRP